MAVLRIAILDLYSSRALHGVTVEAKSAADGSFLGTAITDDYGVAEFSIAEAATFHARTVNQPVYQTVYYPSGLGPFWYDYLIDANWATEVAAGRGTEGQEFTTFHGFSFKVYSTPDGARDDAVTNRATSGQDTTFLVVAGDYTMTSTLELTCAGNYQTHRWIGSGPNRTKFLAGANSTAIVNCQGEGSGAGVDPTYYIEDIGFDGNAKTGCDHINIRAGAEAHISNVRLVGIASDANGIDAKHDVRGIWVSHSYLQGTGIGIQIGSLTSAAASCFVQDCYFNGFNIGIHLRTTSECHVGISGNEFWLCDRGVSLSGQPNQMYITGNLFHMATNDIGIAFRHGNGYNYSNTIIATNVFKPISGTGAGIDFSNLSSSFPDAVFGINIIGNTFEALRGGSEAGVRGNADSNMVNNSLLTGNIFIDFVSGTEYPNWDVGSGCEAYHNISTDDDVAGTPTTKQVLADVGSPVGHTGLVGQDAAPDDAQYLTLALDGDLSAERRFVPGTALTAVDGGADGDYTLNHDQVAVGDLHQDYILADGSRAFTGALDMGGYVINNVGDPVLGGDAVNLDTLLDSLAITLAYFFGGSSVMSPIFSAGENHVAELVEGTPQELTTIIQVASAANTPAPFTISAGTLISIHFDAKVLSTTGRKPTFVYVQLGYVDADGSSNFVQIGGDSDPNTTALTTAQTVQEQHIHVAADTTVPAGKRLKVKWWATTTGATGDPTIWIYYGAVQDHMHIPVSAGILGNYTLKATLTTEGDIYYASAASTPARLAVGAVGTVLIGGASVPSYSGSPSLSGTLTVDTIDEYTGNAGVTVEGVQFLDSDILLTTTNFLQFRDSALKIFSSTDGQLDIDADTEVEITATIIDLAGTVTLQSNILDFGNSLQLQDSSGELHLTTSVGLTHNFTTQASIVTTGSDTAALWPVFLGRRSKGSIGSPTAITATYIFGGLEGQGYDGSAYAEAATLVLRATENWSGSAHGSQIDFYVVPSTTTTLTLSMTLNDVGQLQLPISGVNAGLLLGGDALLYRVSANLLRTPDGLTVDGALTASGGLTVATITDILRVTDVAATTPELNFQRARVGPAAVALNDILMQLGVEPHDGAGYDLGARIVAQATENHNATDHGQKLGFFIVPNGDATLGGTIAVVIDQDGELNCQLGLRVVGNIAVSGTVDGVDIAARDHAQAHGAGDHTEHGNHKLLYTDGSGDEQELALAANNKVLTADGAAAAPVFEYVEETTTFIVENPTASENLVGPAYPWPITVTRIKAVVIGGTSVTIDPLHGNLVTDTTDLLTAPELVATANTDGEHINSVGQAMDTTFKNVTLAAGDFFRLVTTAIDGVPTQLSVTITWRLT